MVRRIFVGWAWVGMLAWLAGTPMAEAQQARIPAVLTVDSGINTDAQTGASASKGPSLAPTASISLQRFLRRASDFEEKKRWQQAADVYQRALRQFPSQTDLKGRLVRAERLNSLSQRYHDRSFRDKLLALSENDALALFDEVIRKVEAHHVDRPDYDKLARQGYAGFRLALESDDFVKYNITGDGPTHAKKLLQLTQNLPNRTIGGRASLIKEIRAVAQLAKVHGLQRKSAVVLEFLTAAAESLDPYSAHLSPDRLKELYSMIEGNFVGLGVEVRAANDGLYIASVLPESPAEKAGVKGGDTIIAIDGTTLKGVVADDAANRLQGPEGSKVSLSLKCTQGTQRAVVVTRQEVEVPSIVNVHMIDNTSKVGYLRLTSFQRKTMEELDDAMKTLLRQGMRRLILDLRGNPGGLLEVGVQVADAFIKEGMIVSTKGRAWGQDWAHRAGRRDPYTVKMVVLVDGDSASASEILAGALQDHGRATILGTTTYGKGSVQSIFPLREAHTGLRLTTARFFSPKGKAYEGVGVVPDVKISRPRDELGIESEIPLKVVLEKDNQLQAALSRLVEVQAPVTYHAKMSRRKARRLERKQARTSR